MSRKRWGWETTTHASYDRESHASAHVSSLVNPAESDLHKSWSATLNQFKLEALIRSRVTRAIAGHCAYSEKKGGMNTHRISKWFVEEIRVGIWLCLVQGKKCFACVCVCVCSRHGWRVTAVLIYLERAWYVLFLAIWAISIISHSILHGSSWLYSQSCSLR